jgi:hypothetical protein
MKRKSAVQEIIEYESHTLSKILRNFTLNKLNKLICNLERCLG